MLDARRYVLYIAQHIYEYHCAGNGNGSDPGWWKFSTLSRVDTETLVHCTKQATHHHLIKHVVLERVEFCPNSTTYLRFPWYLVSKENKRKYQLQGLGPRWRVSACRRFIRMKQQPGREKQFFFPFEGGVWLAWAKEALIRKLQVVGILNWDSTSEV